MPIFVDRIIVVNDKSKDNTSDIVRGYILKENTSKKFIQNILDDIKPDRYNKANIVLQKLQKVK